jgi:hypothetical protein
VGYAPSEETDDVYSEYRVPAVRRRPATARTVRSSGLHRWAAKVRAGKVDTNTGEEGGDYPIGGNETDDVDDDGDVDSTLDVIVDRVSDVPTTPRRVQSTRLSAWANRSRVLTPVKSDDTEEEDTEEEEEEEEDTDTAPTPVRSSPSQNLADARRELRIRRTEEAERGARKILVADAAASDEENQDFVGGPAGQSPYVDEAEAAERRERIMRETKAELRRSSAARLRSERSWRARRTRRRRGNARGSFEGRSCVDRTGSKKARTRRRRRRLPHLPPPPGSPSSSRRRRRRWVWRRRRSRFVRSAQTWRVWRST